MCLAALRYSDPSKSLGPQPHWDFKRGLGASGCSDPMWSLGTCNCTVTLEGICMSQGVQIPRKFEGDAATPGPQMRFGCFRMLRSHMEFQSTQLHCDPEGDLDVSGSSDPMEVWGRTTTLGPQKGFESLRVYRSHMEFGNPL